MSLFERLKVLAYATKYPKGSFGYWWTVKEKQDDIEGKTYNGSIEVDTDIKSLEGCPKIVKGDFIIQNSSIKSLKGGPTKVEGSFECMGCLLTSLEGGPKEVGDYYNCQDNELTTLKGAPVKIHEDFNCEGNNLTTLEGGPKEVEGDFNCSRNKLKDLKGSPKVGGVFSCFCTTLTSLEGFNGNINWIRAPKDLITKFKNSNRKFSVSSLIDYMIKNNKISIDNGKLDFILVKLDPKNFSDSSKYKNFFNQLKDEGKTGWYSSMIVKKGVKPSVSNLPIFGHKDYYETKWFTAYPEDTLRKDIRDFGILDRV